MLYFGNLATFPAKRHGERITVVAEPISQTVSRAVGDHGVSLHFSEAEATVARASFGAARLYGWALELGRPAVRRQLTLLALLPALPARARQEDVRADLERGASVRRLQLRTYSRAGAELSDLRG